MFIFIFPSLARDSAFFDFQVNILVYECGFIPFGKSQRKVFHRQETHLLTLPCHQQHHTVSLAFPQLDANDKFLLLDVQFLHLF